jgi:DUF218 domain
MISTRLLTGLFCFSVAFAQAHRPVELWSPVQDKNFYVLSLIQHTPGAAKALAEQPALKQILNLKRAVIEKGCEQGTSCYMDGLRWTDAEIAAASQALSDPAVQKLLSDPLKESGMYVRYSNLPADAWPDAARSMNRIIDVYGDGKKPRYPEIDSPSFDVKAPAYAQMVRTAANLIHERDPKLFFEPTLEFSLYLLELNARDEAGRLEPLEQKENAAVVKRIPSIQWDRFPYTVIVIPGAGGDRTTWALSPAGKLRVEIAARRYKDGKAPLILVSGGYVHPNQTPYAEALQMKKSLMTDFGVPENAILIDPHARHTTTNLRNAARHMYRYGIPFEKTALISTDGSQSTYIEGAVFTKRCDDELGYQPHKILKRTSVFDLEFLPRIESLQLDATDPLDP